MALSAGKRGLVALVIALVALGAAVRLRAEMREGPDLKPRPDALEYGLCAARLASQGSLALRIGDVDYPSRYPFGFALLAAPIVKACGGAASSAWRAAFLYGLLAIALTTLLGHLLAGPVAAALAGLIVALSPRAVDASLLAMSETASMTLWALPLILVALMARRRGPTAAGCSRMLLTGAAIGLGLTVRYTNLAVLLPIVLLVGTRHAFTPPRLLRNVIAIALPIALAGAALLLYQHRAFGDALRNGYEFWVPKLYGTDFAFSLVYAFKPGPLAPWASGHLACYGRALAGMADSLVTPALAALAALGLGHTLLRARICPVARLLALTAVTGAGSLLCFYLTYYWQDVRFLLPILPVLAVLAGAGAHLVHLGLRRILAPGLATAVVGSGMTLLAAQLAWPLIPGLRDGRADPPPLVSRLDGLDRDLERDCKVIVNFPLTLAAPALGRDRELVLAVIEDPGRGDPHLNAIHSEGLLSPLSGTRPDIPYLAAGPVIERGTFDAIASAVRSGRTVYFVEASGEGSAGPGITALRGAFRFEEQLYRAPVTVYRLR